MYIFSLKRETIIAYTLKTPKTHDNPFSPRDFNNTSFPKVMLVLLGVPWNPTHNQGMGTYQPILSNEIEFITISFCSG
jgi:hypothetical protein